MIAVCSTNWHCAFAYKQLVLFRNGEATPLSVLLEATDMKGVAQSEPKDARSKALSGSDGAGEEGKRSASQVHSAVRVEATDDLTVCITPSAGK